MCVNSSQLFCTTALSQSFSLSRTRFPPFHGPHSGVRAIRTCALDFIFSPRSDAFRHCNFWYLVVKPEPYPFRSWYKYGWKIFLFFTVNISRLLSLSPLIRCYGHVFFRAAQRVWVTRFQPFVQLFRVGHSWSYPSVRFPFWISLHPLGGCLCLYGTLVGTPLPTSACAIMSNAINVRTLSLSLFLWVLLCSAELHKHQ